MDAHGNVQPDDKESSVEDLSVNAVEAGEVKGGAVIYRNINGTWTALSSDAAVDSTSNQHGTHVAGTIAAIGN